MGIVKRNKSIIVGLDTDLTNLNTAISTEATARASADGVLANLTTTEKGNLVGALNEVKGALDTERTARLGGNFTAVSSNFYDGWEYDTTSHTWVNNVSGSVSISTLSSALTSLNASNLRTKTSAKEGFEYLNTRINNALSNIDPAALDSLTEIVAAFQAADSNLNNTITQLANSASGGVAAETAARIAADMEIKQTVADYTAGLDTAITGVIESILIAIKDPTKLNFNTAGFGGHIATAHPTSPNSGLRLSNPITLYGGSNTYGTGHWFFDRVTSAIEYADTRIEILNFGTVRTVIDGQAYDLEASLTFTQGAGAISTVVKGLTWYNIADVYVDILGLSPSDVALFTGKSFLVQANYASVYAPLSDTSVLTSGIKHLPAPVSGSAWTYASAVN